MAEFKGVPEAVDLLKEIRDLLKQILSEIAEINEHTPAD